MRKSNEGRTELRRKMEVLQVSLSGTCDHVGTSKWAAHEKERAGRKQKNKRNRKAGKQRKSVS